VVLWNSNHNVFCDLLVQQTGQQGFIAKGPLGSSYNTFRQNEIRETGKENTFVGEGFYIGAGGQNAGGGNAWSPSNRNWVYRNKIGPNVTADHVDLKPTTEGNIVEENISDLTGFRFHVGNIAVQGAYTQSQVLSAVIKNNVLTNLSNPEGSTETRAGFFNYQGSNVSYHGNSVSGTGYQEGYRTLGGSGNVVGCDNTAVGYSSGFSNVACQ